MERSRNWCFTFNNPKIEDEENILGLPHAGICEYVIYGRETGSMCLTFHLQGFIVFKTLKAKKQVMELGLGHISEMYSTFEDCIAYCKKDGDYMEAGTAPCSQKEKGAKCKELYEGVWKAAAEGRIMDIPEKIRFKHVKQIEHIQAKYGRHLPSCPDIELKDWQEQLFEHLQQEPDSRKIIVIVDKEGGQGKSTFCRWLMNKIDGVELFTGGASKDISYMVKSPKVALFDFARCHEEHLPWYAVESIKNGAVANAKYESAMKFFDTPHVVVFTNHEVPVGVLSEDRLKIIDITPIKKFVCVSEGQYKFMS